MEVLKDAIITKLKINASPDRIRLFREVEEGSHIPLNSRKTLDEQDIFENSSIIVEVIPKDSSNDTFLQMPMLSISDTLEAKPILEYRGLEQHKELSIFYRAVKTAKSSPKCEKSSSQMWRIYNSEMSTIKQLKWPFLDANVLIERDFYSSFLTDTKWLNNLTGDQIKIAVLGQPGIGKSAFGIWLLLHLLQQNRTVVYSRNFSKVDALPDIQHFNFHNGVAYTAKDLGPIVDLLSNPIVIHLCDSIKPQSGGHCHKILISSPDPLVWRWFVLKEYAGTAYFPLFSFAEMEALRTAEFGNLLPPETLALRVRAWGLSTRAVFSPKQKDVAKDIMLAMSNKSLEELQKAMSQVRAPTGGIASDTPHALFMLHADRETLNEGEVTFRSEAVAKRVSRMVASRTRDTLIPVLQQLLFEKSTRTVAGTVFEFAAMDVLVRSFNKGKFYEMRPLFHHDPPIQGETTDVNTGMMLQMQMHPSQQMQAPLASTMKRFDSLSQLAKKCLGKEFDFKRQFFKPSSANLASIDFIGPNLLLFQITTNTIKHAIKVTSGRSDEEGLLAIYRTLLPLFPDRFHAKQPYLDFCFVVPEGNGRKWKAQTLHLHTKNKFSSLGLADLNIVQIQGEKTGFFVDGKVIDVRQYLLELPSTVFDDWLAMDEMPRDDIDEAAES